MTATVIVLAMHGAPPKDFPPHELMEMMGLHARLESGGLGDPALQARYNALDEKIRRWPRTPKNDPFHAASGAMAQALAAQTGLEVRVGFNEFCAPTLTEALEAAAGSAERVDVITPMLTRGGEHAEEEIPAIIAAARARHPEVTFEYCWPFDLQDIACFLAAQVRRFRSGD